MNQAERDKFFSIADELSAAILRDLAAQEIITETSLGETLSRHIGKSAVKLIVFLVRGFVEKTTQKHGDDYIYIITPDGRALLNEVVK